MALTLTNPGTFGSSPIVPGNRRERHVRVTFDANYPSGGYAVTAATFGLTTLDRVFVAGTSLLGRWVSFDHVNSKIQIWKAFTVENDTADMSLDSVQVIAIGR